MLNYYMYLNCEQIIDCVFFEIITQHLDPKYYHLYLFAVLVVFSLD